MGLTDDSDVEQSRVLHKDISGYNLTKYGDWIYHDVKSRREAADPLLDHWDGASQEAWCLDP